MKERKRQRQRETEIDKHRDTGQTGTKEQRDTQREKHNIQTFYFI